MSNVFEIKAVRGPKEWSGQYGPMHSYFLDLDGGEGVEQGVKINRKPDSKVLQIGEVIAGHVEDDKFGPKFVLDTEATKELTQPQTRSQPSSRPSSGGGRGDNVQHSIARQVALKILAPTINEKRALTDDVKGVARDLENFILEAGQAVNSGQEQSNSSIDSGVVPSDDPPSSTPAQNSPPADEEAQKLDDLLYKAGVSDGEERRWLLESAYRGLLHENRMICLGQLESVDKKQKAVEQLWRYAGAMPDSFREDGDAIPF